VLDYGTGTRAVAAALNAAAGILCSGVSQKRTESGSTTVRGTLPSCCHSLRLVLTPGAVGVVSRGSRCAGRPAWRSAWRGETRGDYVA
jgi:hypothetical protein